MKKLHRQKGARAGSDNRQTSGLVVARLLSFRKWQRVIRQMT